MSYNLWITSYKLNVWKNKLKFKTAISNPWVQIHELQVQLYKLRVQIHKLLVPIHKLQVQIYKLWVQTFKLRVPIYELQVQITSYVSRFTSVRIIKPIKKSNKKP